MKHNKYPQDQLPGADGSSRPTPAELAQGATDFAPAPEEVARKAYFSFLNHGSRPGHEVQHWLKAEADLIAERNRTRVHGYHNPT